MKTPSEFASDLEQMLEAPLPSSTVFRASRLFHAQGVWSPRDPVNENGACLLVSWLEKVFRGYDVSPPDMATISFLLDGRAMREVLESRPRSHGASLKAALFDRFSSVHQSTHARFLWSPVLLDALSNEDLKRVSMVRSQTRNDGSDVLRLALMADQVDAVKWLINKGWAWQADGAVEDSPATYICSPQAWDLFCATGGNPFQEISIDGDSGKTLPLWRYLIERKGGPSSPVGVHVQQWVLVHAPDGLKAKEQEDYWKGLQRAHTQQGVLQAIRAQKDWPQLINSKGQNVLMVGMERHLGVFEKLASVGRAAPLFSHVDQDGWSVWHYLLSRGREVSDEAWKIAISKAPVRPRPESGLLVTMLRKDSGIGHSSLPEASAFKNSLRPGATGAPTEEDWWAGTPEEHESLGRYLQGDSPLGDRSKFYWGARSPGASSSSVSRASLSLSLLVDAFPPPETLPASLLGGLALNELISANYRGGATKYQACDRLIEAGACVNLSKQVREEVENLLGDNPDSLARLNQLSLNSALEPVSGSRARPRM